MKIYSESYYTVYKKYGLSFFDDNKLRFEGYHTVYGKYWFTFEHDAEERDTFLFLIKHNEFFSEI